MPLVGASRRSKLYLRARGVIEVRGLVRCVNLNFLDAVLRRRHHARRSVVELAVCARHARGIAREGGGIYGHAAVHVIGDLPAIQQKGALIVDRSSHAAGRIDTGLHRCECIRVVAQTRQRIDGFLRNGLAHSGVQGLQLGANRLNFDRFRAAAYFEGKVDRQLGTDVDDLPFRPGDRKPGPAGADRIGPRRHRRKNVFPVVIRDLRHLESRRRIAEYHRGAWNQGAALVGYLADHCTAVGCLAVTPARACARQQDNRDRGHDPP